MGIHRCDRAATVCINERRDLRAGLRIACLLPCAIHRMHPAPSYTWR